MKIKMTNEEIVQNIDLLRRLKERGKLGYAIMRNQRKLEEESTEYRKIKEEMIKKHGVERELKSGGKYFTVPKENHAAFMEDIKDVAAIEEEVDVFTVTEEEFVSGNLTSDQMSVLFWMVKAK